MAQVADESSLKRATDTPNNEIESLGEWAPGFVANKINIRSVNSIPKERIEKIVSSIGGKIVKSYTGYGSPEYEVELSTPVKNDQEMGELVKKIQHNSEKKIQARPEFILGFQDENTKWSKMRNELQKELKELVSDRSCENSSQCKSVGIGNKSCGGYARYALYSTKNTDEKKLLEKAEIFFNLDRAFHREIKYISNCGFATAGVGACISGKCTELGSKNQITPLHLAVVDNDHTLIELLLKQGIDVNTTGKGIGQKTPLMLAVGIKSVTSETIRALLKAGANPNSIDYTNRDTALHIASRQGNLEAVKLLLEYGADPTKRNLVGTPLEISEKYSQSQITQLLKKTVGK